MKELIIMILQRGWVKRNDLHRHLTSNGYHLSDREMRACVEDMVVREGFLIASSERGYKLITTDKEYEAAIRYLEKKAEAIAIRKNCLISNYSRLKSLTDQLTLFE